MWQFCIKNIFDNDIITSLPPSSLWHSFRTCKPVCAHLLALGFLSCNNICNRDSKKKKKNSDIKKCLHFYFFSCILKTCPSFTSKLPVQFSCSHNNMLFFNSKSFLLHWRKHFNCFLFSLLNYKISHVVKKKKKITVW